jgi:hypothetical protein
MLSVNCAALRPFNGISIIFSPSITSRIVEVVVSTWTAPATTLTVSVVAPTSSLTFTVAVWSAAKVTPFWLYTWKPEASTVRL